MSIPTASAPPEVGRILSLLQGVRRGSAGGYEARCPAHEDGRQSLSIGVGEDGRVLLHCHAGCSVEAVVGALGLGLEDLFSSPAPAHPSPPPRARARGKLVAAYDYHAADGTLLCQVLRYAPKSFSQRRPDPDRPGAWINNMRGVPRVLYRLPAVLLRGGAGELIWLAEGEKDADALCRIGLCGTTGIGGAGKWEASYAEALCGSRVVILPDHDPPGQKYAQVAARALCGMAASVRIVNLPGLSEHGDVSDWLAAGGTREQLETLARETTEWTPAIASPSPAPQSHPDAAASARPSVVNFLAEEFELPDGSTKTRYFVREQAEIVGEIHTATGGWPRIASGLLFAADSPVEGQLPRPEAVHLLDGTAELFSWLRRHASVGWSGREMHRSGQLGKVAPLSRGELVAALRSAAPEVYEAVELLPHVPPRPRTHYIGGGDAAYPEGDGRALANFLALLNPDTDLDRDLLAAALLTPLWGGLPGTRPGIVLTSPWGVGCGKTATAEAIGAVYGGLIAVRASDDWAAVTARLLDAPAMAKRIVLLDNLRSKLAVAELESAITAQEINGKRMYRGDACRPNSLTWLIAANTPELSRDLADRCVIIQIGKPRHGIAFAEQVSAFLDTRRHALLCDLAAQLRHGPVAELAPESLDRFQSWQRAVLATFPRANELAALCRARRPAVDSDAREAEEIVGTVEDLLRANGHDPALAAVVIPKERALEVLGPVLGAKTTTGLTRRLRALAGGMPTGLVDENYKHPLAGRGILWRGPAAATSVHALVRVDALSGRALSTCALCDAAHARAAGLPPRWTDSAKPVGAELGSVDPWVDDEVIV